MQILSVKLHTTNIDAQRVFYTETLGFSSADGGEATGFAVCAGQTRLTFEPSPDDVSHFQHIAFNIPPQQFEAACAWIEARVTTLQYEGRPYVDFSASSWRARSVYFEDAGGNVLELIARERLHVPEPLEPFGVASVLGISEIGIAADHIPDLTRPILEQLALPLFDGDPSGTFCAFGDDNGLLIVVEAGRNWLPTDNRPSGIFPVAITLAGDEAHTLEHPPYTLATRPTA